MDHVHCSHIAEEYELTNDEYQEKEELQEEAFANWNKRDYQLFVRGCTEYGRNNLIVRIEFKRLN